jgi:transposase
MPQSDSSYLFETSPAVQAVRMRNAPWVIPFLFKAFKKEKLLSLPEPALIGLLAEELRNHTDGTEDLEEARIEFGEDEESRARKYLLNWVQKRLLQDFPDADAVTHYQLSAHSEKLFQWLQSLEKKQFVGTESRFRFLFQTLREMVEYTEDDAAKRLDELKNRKAELDKEIKKIEMGIKPEIFTNAQLRERLDWFTRLSHELLSDFREVEDNFKLIHRHIVEQHTRAEINKGSIVGYAFEAYDALRKSDQGKSFYAFWDFLLSRAGQEEWRQLTDQLLQLLEDRNIENDGAFVEDIKSLLLQQGRSVYEANDRMAEKLSRIITEKEIARHRRLRQQIGGIKEQVFRLMAEETPPCGLILKTPAPIRMNMERKLTLVERQGNAVLKQPVNGREKIDDLERFGRLFHNTSIDKKLLWKKVEQVLQKRTTATLLEILDQCGLDNGIAEIITYFSFLREKASQVQYMQEITELIPLDPEKTRFLEVPYLLFSR